MPFFQAMAKQANAMLTKEALTGKPSPFAETGSLVGGLKELGVVPPGESDEAAFIDAFPSGLKEAVRAVLHDNLSSGKPLDVTVAWSPGYEDEVTLFQVADNERTKGGITILVKSRYPGDRGTPGTGIR